MTSIHHPIYGYHGTHQDTVSALLEGDYRMSRNDYDWLGDGVYFWQDAEQRAWEWARRHHGERAAVIGAEIHLRDCVDLFDISWEHIVRAAYRSLHLGLRAAKLPLPSQLGDMHRIDREVMNLVVEMLAQEGRQIRVVRAAFREGYRLFYRSAFFDRTHVEVAVRDPALIVRTWTC